jgi:hypothetical protein
MKRATPRDKDTPRQNKSQRRIQRKEQGAEKNNLGLA